MIMQYVLTQEEVDKLAGNRAALEKEFANRLEDARTVFMEALQKEFKRRGATVSAFYAGAGRGGGEAELMEVIREALEVFSNKSCV